jgi:hypothetical protein
MIRPIQSGPERGAAEHAAVQAFDVPAAKTSTANAGTTRTSIEDFLTKKLPRKKFTCRAVEPCHRVGIALATGT